jgi:hypothetical protein
MAPAGVRESKQQGWTHWKLPLCFVLRASFHKKSRLESLRISLIQNDDDEKKHCKGLFSSARLFTLCTLPCDFNSATALLEQAEAGAMVMGSYGESMQSSLTFTLCFAALIALYRRAPLAIRTMTIQPSVFLSKLIPATPRSR